MTALCQLESAVQVVIGENRRWREHNEAMCLVVRDLAKLLGVAQQHPLNCLFCNKPYGLAGLVCATDYLRVQARCGHVGVGSDCFDQSSLSHFQSVQGAPCSLAHDQPIHMVQCYACRPRTITLGAGPVTGSQQVAAAVTAVSAESKALREHNKALIDEVSALGEALDEPPLLERPFNCLFCDQPYGLPQYPNYGFYTEATAKCGHKGVGNDCCRNGSINVNLINVHCKRPCGALFVRNGGDGMPAYRPAKTVDCCACRNKV